MKKSLFSPNFKKLLAGALLASPLATQADVTLPTIFGDHMVLQQGTTLPVWGRAKPGEKIAVSFGANRVQTAAGADGKWRVDLPAVAGGTPPGTLVVAGANTLTINDVLIGDVWLCSGQSNMEYGLSRGDVATATDDQIRLFHVPHQLAISPRDDVKGSWQVCSPQTATGFSAVAYFFGRDLRPVLKRPIGLIESSVGGTGAQEWTDVAALRSVPSLHHYVDSVDKIVANYPDGDAGYRTQSAAYEAAMTRWNDALKADPGYQEALKAFATESERAKAAGQPLPPAPKTPVAPPAGVVGKRGDPTLLFNGMIAPLIPYAIKGTIWYQGENNGGNTALAAEYQTLFPTMITGWRSLWKEGDFPFLFVQLANLEDSGRDWPRLRESQLKTLSVPHTGMAVTVDIGTAKNIHPPDKADVGARLALAARHVAYGETLVYSGPIYETMKPEPGGVRVSFRPDSIGGGLIIGTAPWIDPKAEPVSKTELEGFLIAGEDKKWVPAQAKIERNTLLVSSAQVPKPVAVRYAWANNPRCNLYNRDGLPASPFRTDDWTESAAATRKPEPAIGSVSCPPEVSRPDAFH